MGYVDPEGQEHGEEMPLVLLHHWYKFVNAAIAYRLELLLSHIRNR